MSKPDTKQLFISVGSRFAMNRLLRSVEDALGKYSTLKAKAQIGQSTFQSKRMEIIQWANASDFDRAVSDCDIFISHAGMGNILLAAKYKKPIIIMPRRMDQGEHINDHQLSTAKALKERSFIHIANNSAELEHAIAHILCNSSSLMSQSNSNQASKKSLISSLRNFIDNGTI